MYNLKQRNNEKRKQSYHYRRSDIPNLLDIAIIRILFINFKSIKIMGQKTYKKTILSDFNEDYKKKKKKNQMQKGYKQKKNGKKINKYQI